MKFSAPYMAGLLPACVAVAVLSATCVAGAQGCDADAAAPPLNQFREDDQGTVTDARSRLTWMRCALGQVWSNRSCVHAPTRLSWDDAKSRAAAINASGEFFYDDWRLPTVRELATITKLHCRNPRADVSVFPQTQADFYWSASTKLIAGPELVAFALSFGPQGVQPKSLDEACFVRLVRSAAS